MAGGTPLHDILLQEIYGSVWRQLLLLKPGQECYKHLVGPGVQLNILQDTGQSLTAKLFSQNVYSAKTEKPYLRTSVPRKRKVEAAMSIMT